MKPCSRSRNSMTVTNSAFSPPSQIVSGSPSSHPPMNRNRRNALAEKVQCPWLVEVGRGDMKLFEVAAHALEKVQAIIMSGDLFGKHRCNRLDFPGMRRDDDERLASPLMFHDDAIVSAFDILSAQGFEVGVFVGHCDSF